MRRARSIQTTNRPRRFVVVGVRGIRVAAVGRPAPGYMYGSRIVPVAAAAADAADDLRKRIILVVGGGVTAVIVNKLPLATRRLRRLRSSMDCATLWQPL